MHYSDDQVPGTYASARLVRATWEVLVAAAAPMTFAEVYAAVAAVVAPVSESSVHRTLRILRRRRSIRAGRLTVAGYDGLPFLYRCLTRSPDLSGTDERYGFTDEERLRASELLEKQQVELRELEFQRGTCRQLVKDFRKVG